MMTDSVVILKVDAHIYICGVLRKADQHVPSGELVGTSECIKL